MNNNSQRLMLSSDFGLPLDAATETIAIVARRGAGKTYTARKLTEGLLLAGIPVCVIDPIGVWWGLRSSDDGKGDGLPIYILGGERADAPLTPESGEVVADMVHGDKLSCVLDLSAMRKGQRCRFMTAFAERLYHVQREALHLVVDEADEFAPQRVMGEDARMLGAMEDLVRRGRARGIGMTMITQRPSVINKNVLTQCEILIALQMSHNLDLKAVDEWIKLHGSEDKRAEFLKTVPTLQKGNAWVWSPSFLDVFKRIQVAKCRTFDSSATPKAGARRVTAKKLAAVNLDVLREQMAEQIAAAEKDDPKRLHARIAELERKLDHERAPTAELRRAFEAFVSGVHETLCLIDSRADELSDLITARLATVHQYQTDVMPKFSTVDYKKFVAPTPSPEPVVPKSVSAPTGKNGQNYASNYSEGAAAAAAKAAERFDAETLPKVDRAILTVLAQHGVRNKNQLAIQSGYSGNSGNFRSALARLRAAEEIQDVGVGIGITKTGLTTLGPYTPLPTGKELARYWLTKLNKCEGAILQTLIEAHPGRLTKECIGRATDYSVNSGNFRSSLAKLRTLELISGFDAIEASHELVN